MCLAGGKPDAKKPKYVKRDAALKQSVLNYVEAAKKAAEAPVVIDVDSADEADEQEQEQAGNQWVRTEEERKNWHNTPEMVLLSAIAHNSSI